MHNYKEMKSQKTCLYVKVFSRIWIIFVVKDMQQKARKTKAENYAETMWLTFNVYQR